MIDLFSRWKGTPGPWTLRARPHFIGIELMRRRFEVIFKGPLGNDYIVVPEVSGDDGRLIAKAPVLFLQAERTVNFAEVTHPEEGTVHCLMCGEITDPQVAHEGKVNHSMHCPIHSLRLVLADLIE